ncbi:MAG: glycosyltransferase family 2 protein [Candidatus Heteroscillospira sp.]|jgi:cellulose synthase/poly-beta-1,6-N-acetylglucosamine synthase-like glycosyltransferase
MTELIRVTGQVMFVMFLLFYGYQFIYMLVPFFVKKSWEDNTRLNRFAVLIAARNEETVIGKLVESVKQQDYPAELVDVFVVADNCTDGTAREARRAGAEVYERFDTQRVGKGYALNWLLGQIHGKYGKKYDGYFVFDADNLLSTDYISQMNRVFSEKYPIVTGCRNSKNFGDSWISAGNALRFLRDSEYLNRSRMLLGTDCSISGTGFLVSRDVLMRAGGWHFFLISEDTEFAVSSILRGERIGYCHEAVFYDEQPQSFEQSWKQRMRWVRGSFQVFGKYGGRLFRGFARGNFACYDVGLSNFPMMVMSCMSLLVWGGSLLSAAALGMELMPLLLMALTAFGRSYMSAALIAAFVTAARWKQIHAAWYKKLMYIFTFPIFMFSYVPLSVCAMFGKAQWQPIRHTAGVSLREVVIR